MELIDVIFSIFALIILEIILGIDNLVFLSLWTERLPREKRKKARRWGLTFAWVTRLLLLASAVWIIKLTTPLLTIGPMVFSARDIFLLLGGAFLIVKATQEIHDEVGEDSEKSHDKNGDPTLSFNKVVFQIALMDIIFSLDSVLTAVGLTPFFWVMALAITTAILVMIYASEWVSHIIETHPSIKILALSFLMMIGMVLIADGFSFHVPRGYVYFAMGFSILVESLNLVNRSKRKRAKKHRNQ